MEDSATIERLPLEHPLPQEIQRMERDDTVCKFCGVSYLIHHEVKRLEDQVKTIEQQLEHYKGSVEREKVLTEEVKLLKQNEEEHHRVMQQKETSIFQMRKESLEKDGLIQSLTQSRNSLEEKLADAEKDVRNMREQNQVCKKSLPSMKASIHQQRLELRNIVTCVHQMNKSVQDASSILHNTVQRVCASHSKETFTLKERIETLEDENRQLQQQQHILQQAVQSAQDHSNKLAGMDSQLRRKEEQCNKLRRDIDKLQGEVDSALAKSRASASEAVQYKELLRSKSQELEDIWLQHRKREQVTEQLNGKLQLELKQKSAELHAVLNDCRKLQQQVNNTAQIEEEIQRKVTVNMTETQQLRNALLKAQEECSAIKEEREVMITSHQNRIEQLRESFKQKLTEADHWPQKMDDNLQKERSRHNRELQDLEERMQSAFQMELDIEKQKHQELVDKYKSEHQDITAKMKAELRSIGSHHKAELNQLDRQLQEARGRASAGEDNLKKEIKSLKSIISNLEDRLGRLGLEDNAVLANLKAELLEAEQDLTSSRKETKQMEEKLNQCKEEIMFLQDTVRRECEERFELTEALSEAKEQLLAIQRHSTLGGGSRPTSAKRTSSQESCTNQARGGLSGRVSGPNGLKQPQSPTSQSLSSNSISIGFDSCNVQSSSGKKVQGQKKQGSMSDSRQRIAAAIGRK